MINGTEMLGYICKDADMGMASIQHVQKLVEDDKLHNLLDQQFTGYQRSYEAAEKLLKDRGEKPQSTNPMSKMMANISADMQTFTDRSPSKIADMVIQGSTMGITTITKQLHDYDGKDEEIKAIAEKQILMEQHNIDDLKQFL